MQAIEQKYQNIENESLMEPEKIIRQIAELHELEYEKIVCKSAGYKAIRDEMIKEIRMKFNLSLRELEDISILVNLL